MGDGVLIVSGHGIIPCWLMDVSGLSGRLLRVFGTGAFGEDFGGVGALFGSGALGLFR